MNDQTRSHHAAIEAVRSQLYQDKMEEFERREQEYQLDLDEIKSELLHKNAAIVDDVKREYEMKLTNVTGEMEKLRFDSGQKIEYFKQKESELEATIQNKSQQLHSMDGKLNDHAETIINLKSDLEMKAKELSIMRNEMGMKLLRVEEDLTRKFESEQDKYEADAIRQKQTIVNEFNRTTNLLKEKISNLSMALNESEEKYERRESRHEDLELIDRLKSLVKEKEMQMQQLLDDKRFYEMELVNRETNFNKVFNSSPNVGVLNPRHQSKKKKNSVPNGNGTARFNGSSHSAGMNGSPNRLEPIRTSGSSSPSSGVGGYSKSVKPTPPQQPKKFLR